MFANEITENTVEIVSDENMGLVKQVAQALVKQKILRLTKAYTVLSLTDIAKAAVRSLKHGNVIFGIKLCRN